MGQLRNLLSKELKRRRGEMTQREFAKKLGISKSSLHRIEMREQNVGIDTLELFCKKLKCKLSDLFDAEKNSRPSP